MVDIKKKQTSFFDNTLKLIKPFVSITPKILQPLKSPSLSEKLIWTALATIIYLVASQVPLFGIISNSSKDPLAWMRIMMASNRGTLMDLGISPVVSSSMVMQMITALGLIRPDMSIKEDKILVDTLQKLIAIVITMGQSFLQIYTGYYGSVKDISLSYSIILFIQLFVAGIIIILLDEILQMGYGLGNGVNLFIVANVCERIIWNAFSPRAYATGRGLEFEGCLVAAFHILLIRKNKLGALYELMFRENLPNMFSLLATIFMFCFVVYIQSLRVEIPIISRKHKGIASFYPINLLYTSTMPIIIQGYVISHLSTISKFLFNKWPKNLIVRLLGVWEPTLTRGDIPISGICYYIFPPSSFKDALSRPVFFGIYLSLMIISAAWLSMTWLETHDDNAENVFEKIKNQEMQLKGIKDSSAVERLNQFIPTAACLGGILTSLVIVFSDIASTMGSGNNIFLAASIINQYMKIMAKESAKRSGKMFVD